jgi:hypothetical protein
MAVGAALDSGIAADQGQACAAPYCQRACGTQMFTFWNRTRLKVAGGLFMAGLAAGHKSLYYGITTD